MSDELRATIADVWARHRDDARGSLAVVREAVDRELAGALEDADRSVAAAEAHKLAGALAIYGYAAGSALALRAEHHLDGARDQDPQGLLVGLVQLEAQLAAEAAR